MGKVTAITTVHAHWVESPLVRPYHLSLATLDRFQSVLVEVEDGTGRIGLGEATGVSGYFEGDLEAV
ncbi:MAG: hypothetical protein ACE5I9_06625 [Candidatus Methylomirabilales bacterium]